MSTRVIVGICYEILVHTGVCPQLGLRVFQSQETAKRKLSQGTEAIRQEEGKSSRQGHSSRGFRCNTKERA